MNDSMNQFLVDGLDSWRVMGGIQITGTNNHLFNLKLSLQIDWLLD